MFISIILFFVYCFGFGHSLSLFIKEWNASFFEKVIMKIGFGLALITPVAIMINLFKLPVLWWIFLILSLIGPIYSFRSGIKIPKIKFKKSDMYLIFVLIIFVFSLYMYMGGALSHPWLSDGDSWQHATSIKYIASEKTVFAPEGQETVFRYLDTYPPGYGAVLAILYQTVGSLIPTIKVFNALIISLGYLFFFFFFKSFMKSNKKALMATFILAMVPSFVSRFIWAHSLVITLLPVFLYALVKIEDNKRWAIIAGIVFGCTTLIQPTQPVKFFVMFLIFISIKLFKDKNLLKPYLIVLLFTIIFSLFWWGPMVVKYQDDFFFEFMGGQQSFYKEDGTRGSKPYIGGLGTATRMYYFDDFFTAKSQNQINNPVGWGSIVSILFAFGLISLFFNYKKLKPKKANWRLISLFWFVFTFAGLYGGTVFPIALVSFRFWTLVSIPMALLAVEGMWFLINLGKKINIPAFIILIIVLLGVFVTSGVAKFELNTMQWAPEGAHMQFGQSEAYSWMSELPKETKFFYPCHWEKFGDFTVIAYDLYACPWCDEEIKFREKLFNANYSIDPVDLRNWLVKNNYEYFMIEGNCIDAMSRHVLNAYNITDPVLRKKAGLDATNQFLTNVSASGLFTLSHQTQGSWIWRI